MGNDNVYGEEHFNPDMEKVERPYGMTERYVAMIYYSDGVNIVGVFKHKELAESFKKHHKMSENVYINKTVWED